MGRLGPAVRSRGLWPQSPSVRRGLPLPLRLPAFRSRAQPPSAGADRRFLRRPLRGGGDRGARRLRIWASQTKWRRKSRAGRAVSPGPPGQILPLRIQARNAVSGSEPRRAWHGEGQEPAAGSSTVRRAPPCLLCLRPNPRVRRGISAAPRVVWRDPWGASAGRPRPPPPPASAPSGRRHPAGPLRRGSGSEWRAPELPRGELSPPPPRPSPLAPTHCNRPSRPVPGPGPGIRCPHRAGESPSGPAWPFVAFGKGRSGSRANSMGVWRAPRKSRPGCASRGSSGPPDRPANGLPRPAGLSLNSGETNSEEQRGAPASEAANGCGPCSPHAPLPRAASQRRQPRRAEEPLPGALCGPVGRGGGPHRGRKRLAGGAPRASGGGRLPFGLLGPGGAARISPRAKANAKRGRLPALPCGAGGVGLD